jgi:hypothetical protein
MQALDIPEKCKLELDLYTLIYSMLTYYKVKIKRNNMDCNKIILCDL